MSRNGSGTYTLVAGNPVVTGTTISSTWANNTLTDIATALTGSLASDGQTTATGNLKMGNNRVTGLADGIASTDAATVNQIPSSALFLLKASNLSDVANAATSRTNLGLGTIATQTANSVAVTGGAIDGTTIGTTTRSTVKATTLDLGLSTQSVAIGQGDSSSIKNRIINGGMVIDQRNAGASVTPADSAYTLDRWKARVDLASKMSVQQSSTTPPTGFNYSLVVTSLTTTTFTTGGYYFMEQDIEGYNMADLGWGSANAKTVTISFWVKSSLTGTFGGSLMNSAQDRSYPFTYTISAANTWEQKSVTIAGDTTGTWLTTNGVGVRVSLEVGIGTSLSNTAGAWAAGTYYGATGATNVLATNGATIQWTGVQLEVGSSATGFEYRQYGTELALCQRYYEVLTYNANAELISSYLLTITFYKSYWYFKVNKRASPTITLVSGSWSNQTPTAVAQIEAVLFTNGVGYFYANGTSGNVGLTASAEL